MHHGFHGLGDRLHDVLRDRTAWDIIRRVHLCGPETNFLNSVISSVVTEREEIRSNSVESFIVENEGGLFVDTSPFFSRYCLPKLRRLNLYGCMTSLWDLLKWL